MAIFDHLWSFFGNYTVIFHKTEIQTVILRCLVHLNLNQIKSYNIMLVKNVSFHSSFQGYFAEVNFDNFQETSCHIFKTAIFSKLYEAFMAHIIRKNAGKKFKMISELFINKNFEYTFVLFVSDQSLNWLSCMLNVEEKTFTHSSNLA